MRAALAVLALAACGASLPVPTDLSRIDDRGGDFRKEGVTIGGATCGDHYSEAVAGVPEAEAEIARCRDAIHAAAGGLVGFAALAVVVGVTAHDAPTGLFGLEIGTAAIAFASSMVAAWFARRHRERAIEVYNQAVERATAPRP